MINIAICDDTLIDLETTEKNTISYMTERDIHDYTITKFTSPTKLAREVESGKRTFDLLFLDVIMPKIDGIRIGTIVKNASPKTKVVFLSVSQEFAIDSYTVNAFYYLLKPLEYNKFADVLDLFFEKYNKSHEASFQVKTSSGLFAIDVSEIMYCILSGRHAVIATKAGLQYDSTTVRVPFLEYANLLTTIDSFAICSASEIVNVSCISRLETNKLTMKDGRILSVSRNYRSQLQKKFFEYFSK